MSVFTFFSMLSVCVYFVSKRAWSLGRHGKRSMGSPLLFSCLLYVLNTQELRVAITHGEQAGVLGAGDCAHPRPAMRCNAARTAARTNEGHSVRRTPVVSVELP